MARSIILASSLLTVEVTTLSGPSSLRLAAVFGDHDALITDVAASICACVGNQQLPSSSPIIFSLICVKSSIGGVCSVTANIMPNPTGKVKEKSRAGVAFLVDTVYYSVVEQKVVRETTPRGCG